MPAAQRSKKLAKAVDAPGSSLPVPLPRIRQPMHKRLRCGTRVAWAPGMVLAVAADFEAPGDFGTSLELMNSRGDEKPVEATTFDRHPRGRCAAVDYGLLPYNP